MRLIDARETAAALDWPLLIDALRTLFAEGATVPSRHVHPVQAPGAAPVTSLLMPAWRGAYYGLKTINIAPGNSTRGLPGLHAVYLLFDAATGVPLACIDGDELTARRTVATSALAASWLARPDARRLLVVGAGRLAQRLPWAHRVVRPIEEVQVWARRPEQARALAGQWREQGLQAEAVDDLEAAVRAADIVSCATLATAPLVHGTWLAPGSHLDLIGSFTPQMREADDACLTQARVAVDTEEALSKSGDLIGPIERGALDPAAVVTLDQLARGKAQGRQSASQRTVFKSVGMALEDLAAAMLVHRGSTPQGRSTLSSGG